MIWRAVLLWMENQTTPLKQPIVFELEGFDVQPGNGTFLFLLALLAYIVVLLGNGVVICVIMTDRDLHRPMFVMICHLVVCDLLGATMVLPRLMMDLLTGLKKIAYIPAVAQAFCAHTYGAAMLTILSVMAYDRFVAVCEPLRYHSIMTSARLHSCCALAWIVALLLIAVLFSFHINVPLCGRLIQHVFCTNRGILSLACIPTPISNIYGLAISWSLSTMTFVIVSFSYIRILSASLKQGRRDGCLRSKAFQTCLPHIVVYIIFQISSLIIILSHRFPSLSGNMRKFFSILIYIIPPIINPIIYGLVSKDLRVSFIKHFSNRVKNKH
ncbi:olfactory receptor 2K2-like isoform X4 [Cyprinodon tularosa]|uniref:olfactory receptor 2K2-like isoform X3 n=1 Tax=Cyprinodon tularosa TaxID=77115 RepID=UPI0018E27465|nr:olfactory receptor 2K2-like isoform X3 [Cyprinodon tularosa]XP_038156610.1 olfactory receptor 2K2-like isoform X4 [Cyprinodon tularosa]